GAVPDAQHAVLAGGDHDLLILRGGGGEHEVGGAGEVAEVVAVVGLVEPHGFVTTATDHVLAAPHELDRRHLLGVTADGPRLFAGFDVPDLDGVVGPGAGDEL